MYETNRRSRYKALASGKFRCRPCDKDYQTKDHLIRHKMSASHKRKVAGSASPQQKRRDSAVAAKLYYCATGEKAVLTAIALKKHNHSARHKKKVAERFAGACS